MSEDNFSTLTFVSQVILSRFNMLLENGHTHSLSVSTHTHTQEHTQTQQPGRDPNVVVLPSYTALKPCALTAKSVVNHRASMDPLLTSGEGSMKPDSLETPRQRNSTFTKESLVSPRQTLTTLNLKRMNLYMKGRGKRMVKSQHKMDK